MSGVLAWCDVPHGFSHGSAIKKVQKESKKTASDASSPGH
jgi:hypothetical protein